MNSGRCRFAMGGAAGRAVAVGAAMVGRECVVMLLGAAQGNRKCKGDGSGHDLLCVQCSGTEAVRHACVLVVERT